MGEAPHTASEGSPPGDALPVTPERATPGRKGARCWAGAGSPRPHRPHPGHTGRGAPAPRSRGRAAGGGTAPDTRRPSQPRQANPPGDGPPPLPRHAAPTGHQGQGDSVGPPHPHTRAQSTWVADPNSLPSGRAVGGGTAPALRRPSQRWKAPPPGTPFRHLHSEQRRPPRAHAVEPVLGPHAHTDRTREARLAVPRLPAPEDGRSGEGRRLTPDAPHNSGRPPPPGDGPSPPPRHAAPTGRAGRGQVGGKRDRTAPPQARQTEQGTGAGHAEGHGPRGTALPAPSASPREVRTPHHQGGGRADAAGARAHTHAKGTRGLPEGQPDRARGTHRPRGMAYQRATVRDTRTGRPATSSAGHAGRERGNGRDTTPGTGPSPPNRPRAPRTHGRGTAPAKAVVAHCATPQPLG